LKINLPPNEVLTFLRDSVEDYHISLPLLSGFCLSLSDGHWLDIYEILPDSLPLDLKKQ
jgi:hypothetical protein